MHTLPTTLSKLADICDRDNVRWATSGVLVETKEDGTFTASATDTKSLIRVTGECVGNPESFPVSPAMAAAPKSGTAAIVPGKVWKKIFADAAKSTKKNRVDLRSVAVKIAEHSTTFEHTDGTSHPVETVENIVGRFVPVDAVMPSGRGAVRFRVDAGRLAELLPKAGGKPLRRSR